VRGKALTKAEKALNLWMEDMNRKRVEQKRNVMAHTQKPDLVFQRNGRVHLNRRGCQFSRLLAGEACASAVVMLDRPCPIQCTTAGYPLHSPFSPSFLLPCVSVCHHIPFLLYHSLLHFIITLLNVGNVLLCVIYRLNFTIFKYIKRLSRYITLYIAFGIIRGFT